MDQNLIKKLRVKDLQKRLLVNVPVEYVSWAPDLDADTKPNPNIQYSWALLFVKNKDELSLHIDQILGSVIYDGILWICYPKGTSKIKTDVNRDILWKELEAKGIRPVSQVSLDTTWSAMWFRPLDAVTKK